MSPAWSSIGVKTCLHLPINKTRIHQLVLHQMHLQLWSTYRCDCGGVALASTIDHALFCYYRSSKRRTAQWELVRKERKTHRNKYLQFVTCPSIGCVFLFEICLKSLFVNEKKEYIAQSGQTARLTSTATCRFLVAVATQTDICRSANNLAKGKSIRRISPTPVGTRVAVRHRIRVWRPSKTRTRVKECKYSKLWRRRREKVPKEKEKKR